MLVEKKNWINNAFQISNERWNITQTEPHEKCPCVKYAYSKNKSDVVLEVSNFYFQTKINLYQ